MALANNISGGFKAATRALEYNRNAIESLRLSMSSLAGKANLNGGNTFDGVQKFKSADELGMQILSPDEQTGIGFGPVGGVSFKEAGAWSLAAFNLKDALLRTERSSMTNLAALSRSSAPSTTIPISWGRSKSGFKISSAGDSRSIGVGPLKQNTLYSLFFRAKVIAGATSYTMSVDLFPDTLPERVFTITDVEQTFIWEGITSSHADMLLDTVQLRFFRAGIAAGVEIEVTDIVFVEAQAAPKEFFPALDAATLGSRNVFNVPQRIATSGNISGADYNNNSIDFSVESFHPRMSFVDSSAGTHNAMLAWGGSSSGGLLQVRTDDSVANTYSNIALELDTANNTLTVGPSTIKFNTGGVIDFTAMPTVNGVDISGPAPDLSVYVAKADINQGLLKSPGPAVTDLDAITGEYFAHTQSISTTTGRPTNHWHQIISAFRNNDNGTQLAMNVQGDGLSYRRKNNGTWQPWVSFYHSGNFNPATKLEVSPNVIPDGAGNDLNLYTDTGVYFQNTNAKASSGSNYPGVVKQAGMLEVYTNTSMTYQRYTTYHATSGQCVYHRELYNTTWGDWKLLIDSNNGGDLFFRKDEIPLFAGSASGSEGGEIRLLKSEGSAWAGNFVMDVQGDRLRLWEEGGGYRGFYLDINEGIGGHSKIAHANNLDSLSIPRTNVNNDFSGSQIFRGPSSLNLVTVYGSGNVGNGYGAGVELTVASFEPRIKWEDRSTNALNMLMGYAGGAGGGTFYIRNDSAADNTFADVAMTFNTATKVMQLGGQNVLTTGTGVEKSATNLGRTDNVPLISGTRNAAWWSGLPNGYNVMTNLTTANGSPLSGYGYISKMARRDADGGWCGFWQGYNVRELYFGGANSNADMPSWSRVWHSENFNPAGKLDCAVDGWRNDTSGHPRFWFGTAAGNAIGTTYYRGAEHQWRNATDATIATLTSTGAFYAGADVYNGVNTWFRVRGTNQGIHWENFGGGWFMNDSTWMRVYNNKGIITTGAIQGGTVTGTSDGRLKDIEGDLENAGEILDKLEVKWFTWKETKRKSLGFIAQQVQKFFPRAVQKGADDVLAIEHLPMIALLTKTLQETREELKEVKEELRKLKEGE